MKQTFQGMEMCFPRSNIYYRDEKLDPQLKTVTFSFREDSPYCNGYLQVSFNEILSKYIGGASTTGPINKSMLAERFGDKSGDDVCGNVPH